MSSYRSHASTHASIEASRIEVHTPPRVRKAARAAHLPTMSNNTIVTPITTWQELWASDREVLNRTEVATLLGVDARTVTAAVDSGELPGTRIGRRLLIPRRPLLEKLGIHEPAA